MVVDQVDALDQSSRPQRSGGRQPGRRVAVVLVAFLAAVVMLVGPTTTQDKAQAVAGAAVVAVVGETLGTPASVLMFSPWGFALTAVGVLGWLAYENRDTIGDWLSGLFKGDDLPGPAPGTGYAEQHPPNPYTKVLWSVSRGLNPRAIKLNGWTCQQLVGVGTVQMCPGSAGTGALIATCVATGSLQPYGAVIVMRGSTNGGVTAKSGGTTITAGASPNSFNGHTTDGADVFVCPANYQVARAEGWNLDTSGTTDMLHWTATFGSFPTDVRIDVDCIDHVTGEHYTVQGAVTTDPNGDGTAPVDSPACRPGDQRAGSTINVRPTGDGLWNSTPGPVIDPTKAENFEDCMTLSGTQWVSTGACQTAVWINDQKCTVGDPICYNWSTLDPAVDTVECRWGSHVMPIEDCDPLKQAYRTGYYGTDDGGSTWHETDQNGNPSSTPDPNGGPAPSPNPGGQPGVGSDPNSSTGQDPDGDSGSCWSAIISWNPVDWVVTPVKCALVWAFVPDQGYLAQTMTDVGKSWDRTIVGRWLSTIGDVADTISGAAGSGSGCLGPPLTVSSELVHGPDSTMHPFSTCQEPMATVAGIVKAALTVGVWLGVAFVAVKVIAASVGLNLGSWGKGSDDSAV